MVDVERANRRHKNQITERWLAYVGDCPKITKYIKDKDVNTGWAIVTFIHALLRGYGQVVFANNPFSGILIMMGLFWADFAVGLRGLFSAVIGLAVSIILRHPTEGIENGLTVFNPLLLGLVTGNALPNRYGIEFEPHHWLYLALGSIMTVFVTAALVSLLGSMGQFPVPCLALPFNVVQFMLFVSILHMDNGTAVSSVSLNTSLSSNTRDGFPKTNESYQILADLENTNMEVSQRAYENLEFSNKSSKSINPTISVTWPSREEISATEVLDSSVPEIVVSTQNTTSVINGERIDHNVFVPEKTENISELNTTYGSEDNNSFSTETLTTGSRMERSIDNNVDELSSDMHLSWGKVFSGVVLSASQVFGLCHVPASLMIYLGILIYSPVMAAFCLAGAILGTITGIVLSSTSFTLVYDGVWGFNGLLIAAALSFFYVITWQSVVTTIVGVIFGAVLQNLLMMSLDEANLPVMSVPFNLTSMLFLCLGPDVDGRGLLRPSALSFPEKHSVLHRHLNNPGDKSKTSSSTSNFGHESEMEKRAPLAEAEVV